MSDIGNNDLHTIRCIARGVVREELDKLGVTSTTERESDYWFDESIALLSGFRAKREERRTWWAQVLAERVRDSAAAPESPAAEDTSAGAVTPESAPVGDSPLDPATLRAVLNRITERIQHTQIERDVDTEDEGSTTADRAEWAGRIEALELMHWDVRKLGGLA